ncbi:MAG: SDR family oxidoreductase [Vicinamibacterales bacterium]
MAACGVSEGRVAIVTGGASGIGSAVSRMLARRGDRVAVVDLQPPAAGARDGPGPATFVRADVSSHTDARDAVVRVLDEHGKLDVLVNCAGALGPAGLLSADEADVHRVIAVNLMGTMHMCKYAIAGMRANGGGAIVNVGSISAVTGSLDAPAYAAAKAGVVAFTKSLARKYARHNIRANCVCPGSVLTTNFLKASRGVDATPPERLALARAIPIGRCVDPDEVATLVGFITSRECDALNGATIVLDGGEVLGA